jgi:uridine kinase
MSRINRLMLFVGQRGTGKTTLANNIAAATGKKIIVIDTDLHPFYTDYETITIEHLKTWEGEKCRVIDESTDEVLQVLDRYQSNACVLMEDVPKYMGSNLNESEKRFVINMRKRNFDVIMMFHSLSDIPPYLCKNYNDLVIFKVDDNISVPQRKFNNWDKIRDVVVRVNKHKLYNYCEVLTK